MKKFISFFTIKQNKQALRNTKSKTIIRFSLFFIKKYVNLKIDINYKIPSILYFISKE